MRSGNIPRDGGFISKLSNEEAEEIRHSDPIAGKYLRRIYGAAELLDGARQRYCLWLVDAEPSEVRASQTLALRARLVKAERAGKPGAKGAAADTPLLFADRHQPQQSFLMVPSVSSEHRPYIPMAFFGPEVITTNAVFSIETCDLVLFGLLQSKVFMTWTATVSSRMKSDYQISAATVYNNFPWPVLDDVKGAGLEAAAQGVLDARAAHPRSSLADLYDPISMPPDLRAAHRTLDAVVLGAYGLPTSASDAEILELLFARYQELVAAL